MDGTAATHRRQKDLMTRPPPPDRPSISIPLHRAETAQVEANDCKTIVRDTLSMLVVELLGAYGVTCQPTENEPASQTPNDLELGSVVGVRLNCARGGLVFVAPASLVAELLPVPLSPGAERAQLLDWNGEIANQLAGRLTNRLHARSIPIEVGAPTCVGASSIRLKFSAEAQGVALSFRSSTSAVRVYLDCPLDRVIVKRSVEREAVKEGEVLLF
jgi:hypothetical protein